MKHIGDNWLHVLQGSHATSLKRTMTKSASVTFTPPVGRVVREVSPGVFEMGLTNAQYRVEVPFILDRSPSMPDVSIDGGNPVTDLGAWSAGNLEDEKLYAICLLGDYEIQVTEFAPESEVGAYAVNDCLTATPSNTNATTGGRLTKATFPNAPICGIVSRPVGPAAEGGPQMLSFWSWYHPRMSS